MRSAFANVVSFKSSRAFAGSERLGIVCNDPFDSIQVELERSLRRVSLTLDTDEARRLSQTIDAMASASRGAEVPSVTFTGADGGTLLVRRNVWGDPYEEGVRFEFSHDDDSLSVDLGDDETRDLRKALGGIVKSMSPQVPEAALESEVFLVVTNRADGRLPDPVKAVGNGGQELFFTEDDAIACQAAVVAANGPHYGVYRGVVRIEERLDTVPVTTTGA